MFQQVISRLRRNGSLRRRGNRSTLRKHLMAEFLEERRLLAGVVTDKLDYAPGSTAVIVGTGFDTGETVEFRVLHNDGTSNTGGGHEAWQVTDGSVNDLDGLLDGNVQTTWYVNPDDSADSSFDLTATGMGSGRVATTTFRDSGVLTFDDLSGTSTEIPTGYGGFDWSSSGSSYYSYPDLWHGGYGSAGIGGSQAAWTAYGGQYGYITWLGTGTVNIKGAYFANDSDSPNLYFRGYNNGVLVAQKSVYGLVASPTWVSLNFNGIDQLVVDSGLSGPPSRWWSMDNLTFDTNAVPAITNVVLSATSITENQSTTLSGSFTDLDATDFHTVTIDWGDGSAPTSQNLAAGVLSFSGISHTYLDDAPAGSPSDNMTISVTVSDTLTLGGTAISVSNAATKTIIVNDAAPVVNPLNVSHSNIDETGSTTLSGSFTDPGTLDIHTVTINWGGAEGSETFTLPLGQRSFSRTHQYQDDEPTNTNSDVYQISVTISDDDGGNDVSSEVGGTAPPAVAVLQGGNDSTFWTFSNLNPVMTSTPGSGPWSLTTIASSQLTAAGLAPYNALVINTNDRAFATAQVQADVASWVVSGGRLIIAPTFNLGVDPLTTSLGSDYRIDWSAPDWCGRSQLLVDATHPLLNYPNALDGSTDYSTGYASCDHVSINPGNLGSAWDEAAIVPSLGNVVTLASANAGAGAILAGAIHWDHRTEGQRKLAENMFRYEVSTPASVTVNNVKPVLNSVSATSEDEDGTVTLAGTYSDVGTLDTHTLTVDWGEGTPVTLPVSGGSFSFTHQYLDDDATNSPSDAYTINVTLTDDDMGFDVGSATTIITNVAPVITAFNAPTINENGTATITGSFTDVGSLDSHSVVIDWGDGFSALASVDPLTRTFVASHQYLDDALSPAASDIYSVTMTVTDDDMGSNAHNTTVTVNNLAPTLSVLAASAILENGTTTFSGTIADVGTLDTFTVEIDWDNNGTFDETHTNVGAGKFSYSHQYLDDNPTGTPIDNMPIRVKVTDDDTGSVSGSTTTTVSNVAPVILSLAANSVVENDFVHLTGTYGDAGTLDSHELTIDWGDGSVQTVPVSGGSFDISHQYLDDSPTGTASDVVAIHVTLADDDLGSDSDSVNTTIINVAPTLSNAAISSPVDENGLAILSGNISDPGTQDSFTLTVNWGDGSPVQIFNYAAGTTSFSETHQYVDDNPTGTAIDHYSVTLTLNDDDGASGASGPVDDSGSSAVRAGIGSTVFPANDDGSVGPIPLGFSGPINFFGPLYSSVFVNNNGNITFGSGDHTYTPFGLTSSGQLPRIAPFFADVWTYGDSALATYGSGTVGGHAAFAATWPVPGVHYFADDTGPLRNVFQVVLIERFDTGVGNFDIEFNYDQIEWESGNASGGSSGLGGASAHAGYTNGTGVAGTFYELDGSGVNGAFLDSNTGSTRLTNHSQNSSVPGRYIFQARNGGVITPTTLDVTVRNLPPELLTLAATSVAENGVVHLTGTYHDAGTQDTHSLTINWGEGAPQTVVVTGGSFDITHQYLDDNPTGTASDVFPISVTLTDDDTGSVSGSTTATISNVAPVILSLAATSVVENDFVHLTGTYSDVGTLDTHALTIDWGDGSVQTVPVSGGSFHISHQYLDDDPSGTTSDKYEIVVTITDDDMLEPVSAAESMLYYGGPGTPSDGYSSSTSIGRVELDGTSDVSVIGSAGFVRDLEVDQAGGKVYWADASNPGGSNRVYRANLDGSAQEVIAVVDSGVSGIGLDTENGQLYIGSTYRLYRANLDGTGLVQLKTGYLFNDLEVADHKLYWSSVYTINRSDLDGNNQTALVTGQQSIVGIDVVPSLGIFWADQSSGKVQAADLDGTDIRTIRTGDAGARGIAVDPSAGRVYWGRSGNIRTTALDGSDYRSFTVGASILGLDFAGTSSPTVIADTQVVSVTISNVAPVITAFNAPIINENGTATITGSFTDVGSLDSHSVVIDWGDGFSALASVDPLTRTFVASHQYLDDALSPAASDIYSVTMTVTDDDMGSNAHNTTVTVNNLAPTLSALAASAILENGTTTFSGTIADVGTLDTFTVEIDWDNNGTFDETHTNVGAGKFSYSHQYLDDNPTGTPVDNMPIRVQVTDDDTGSVTGNTTVEVANVAPTLSDLAATAILENGTTIFSGKIADVGSLDKFTVQIDWDNDGTFDETHTDVAAGAFSYTHQYLDDNPTGTPVDNMPIRVQVTDDDTGRVTGNTTVEVSNVAPTLSDLAATAILENGTTTFSGKIADVGSLDKFTVQIDWDNDGTFDETHTNVGGGAFSYTHKYLDDNPTGTPVDNMPIRVQVTDDDTGSVTGNTTVEVTNVAPTLSGLSATAILENGTTIFSGTIADVGSLDTFTVQIDWDNDGTFDETHTNVEAGKFSYSHQYLDDNPTSTPVDNMPIRVQVTDDDTGSVTGNTTVEVTNVAPVILSLAATSVDENGVVHLTGTYSDVGTEDTHTLTINWGEGVPQTVVVTGGSFDIPHQYLDDNPTETGSDIFTIGVTLADDDTDSVSSSTTTTVTNVLPVMVDFNSSSPECGGAAEGDLISVLGVFTDIGTQDTHVATIDWGDGTGSASVTVTEAAGSGTVTANHVYASGGIFTITLTLTDDDGGTIVTTAQAVITGAGVNNGILYVIGTDHDDQVTINAAKDTYKVHSNFYPSGAPFKTFDQAGITQIVVVMCDGNDQVQVAGNIVTPTILDGGEGDDKLNGGAGNNIIIGGDGADELLGGSGRDLLIGGVGSDNLTGNSGEDLLIAGWTDFDGNYAALAAIMAEWSRTDAANGSYEMRRDRLSGSQAGGLNGVNLLTTGAGGSVHDDAAADKLNGSSGRDLYFAEIGSGALDKLNGRANDESIFDLL